MATDAEIILVDYGNILEKLTSIKHAKEVYICDIGINETLSKSLFKELERITSFAVVHYIDHHPLDIKLKNKLSKLGVDTCHSLEESASVLTYLKLIEKLKSGANILATYGAITDYMDDAPSAKKEISRFDRQFILLESTLLTYALLGCSDDSSFKNNIVIALSEMKFPHEIDDVLKYAKNGLEQISRLMNYVSENGVKRTSIAVMESKEGSNGIIANLLIGAFDTQVGVSYRLIKDEDLYEISLRGSYDSKYDLGRIVTQATEMIGGVGGGHKKASGARISKKFLNDFLDMIELQIDMTNNPYRH
ncbi:DHHA1 domain-containing protein [Thermoproteota archaeon]